MLPTSTDSMIERNHSKCIYKTNTLVGIITLYNEQNQES